MNGYWIGVSVTILASFSWALAAIFYRKALIKESSPLVTNLLRAPIAVLVFLLITLLNGKINILISSLFNPSIAIPLLIATIIANIVGDTLYLLAIRNVGVSVSYPLSYSYPIMVAILALIILHEDIHPSLFIGTIIAFVGIWMISWRQKINRKEDKNFKIGALAAIGAATSWALAIVLYRILVMNVDTIVVGTLKLIFLFSLTLPLALIFVRDSLKRVNRRALVLSMIGGLFGIGIGDCLLYIGLSILGAGLAAALTVLAPLLSLVLAYLILKESVTKRMVLGTILIVIGVLIITLIR